MSKLGKILSLAVVGAAAGAAVYYAQKSKEEKGRGAKEKGGPALRSATAASGRKARAGRPQEAAFRQALTRGCAGR